ncbi:MAG: YkgJ family cysteine cluster protein [Bacillota bacterium]|nr:YkgJ family cysteine cluster protein [Bacillota bacterium]
MTRINRTSCIRCGTCCRKGGPVLHHEDKGILLEGHAGHPDLITIRKGELVFDPAAGGLRPAERELVKVRGRGAEWTCRFFDDKARACTIYEHRFLECRLLKCWDPSALLSVIGRNTIARADIINPGDPILKVIEMHERECPSEEVQELIAGLSRGEDGIQTMKKLAGLARKDRAIRSYAISELGLRGEFELFIFGRPLASILRAHGIPVHRTPSGTGLEPAGC